MQCGNTLFTAFMLQYFLCFREEVIIPVCLFILNVFSKAKYLIKKKKTNNSSLLKVEKIVFTT